MGDSKKVLQKVGNAESTTVEWKKSLSVFHEIMETISAFSNTEGGKILWLQIKGKIKKVIGL